MSTNYNRQNLVILLVFPWAGDTAFLHTPERRYKETSSKLSSGDARRVS